MMLYGGVFIMSGYVCYDTQMIVARYEMGDRDFIYHSLGKALYRSNDVINAKNRC